MGVRRPGVGPSAFEFDHFDENLVEIWIDNDGDLRKLQQKVIWTMQKLRLPAAA
jgi:hypothetical protein